MKNLAKIFTVIVVAFTAYSCVADATEDLGVSVGNGEVGTTITLSLEESRTQLGDKTEAGLYPLYWSEGDAIAVNGVASDALTAAQAGKSEAVFKLNGAHNYPYHIVYPVPAEGIVAKTEGCYPVVFPATQEYVAGNLDGKSAPMYGSAEQGASPILHHLTGILRLAIKGDVTLSNLTLAAEEGYLAGTYDVNCETGALTPQDGATSGSIYMSFGDGLALSADEATLIHIAVPEGEYGAVSVVLNTTDDQHMYAKFSSKDDKYIKAGKVREFAEFVFVANSEIDTVVFEISDVATLKQFATLVADNKFYPRNEAKVVAPIDMSGEEWTPIDGFNYTFNGNDQTITGLTAPLFGTAGANIRDLTLADVNIESNGRLTLGAVACVLTDGSISNCKVSGTITVSNTAATIASGANADTTVNIGGVVGTSQGDIDGCVNLADITVNQVANSENTVAVHPSVGGVVGYSVTGAVTNCVNGNEAKTAGAINYHDNQAAQRYVPHVGGVAGRGAADNTSAFTDNTNYGAIDFSANTAGTGELKEASTTIGGVIATSYHNVENNNNYGAITVSGGNIKGFILGGVVGTTTPAVRLYNCHNHQGANITVDSDVAFWALNVAGVVGTFSGSAYVDTCTNDAPIHVKASTDTNATASGNQLYRVGGVLTYANNTVKNCENKENGDITVEGDITLLRANNQPGYGVVGVLCYQTTTGNATNLINRGDINVYTNVTPTASWNTTTTHQTYGKVDVAGVCGYCTRGKYDLQNYGNITIGRAESAISITGNGLHIGGLMSYGGGAWSVSSLSKNINNGKITITNATLNGKFTPSITENAGEDNEKTTTNPWLVSIGGVSGHPTGNISNSTNSGTIDITSNAKFSCETRIGGAIGNVGGDTYKNVSNTGDVTFSGNSGNYTLSMGGMAGANKEGGTYTSCSNNGVITLTQGAKANKAHYIAGLIGYTVSGTKLVSCTNSTKSGVQYGIVIHQTSSTTGGSSAKRIGGIIGQAASPQLTNVSNSAGIYHDGYQLGTAGLSLGGIVGTCSGTPTTSGTISNSGDIYYAGRCPKSNFGIAGIFATPGNGTYTSATITNTGNITIVKQFDDFLPTDNGSHKCVVGGICGYAPKALSNAKSYCTISAPDWRADSGTAANNNFIGAIQGINTPTNHITKCHVGGTFIIDSNEAPGQLNASNYATYLIGGNVITSATAKTQECGFITSIDDTTPEYAE